MESARGITSQGWAAGSNFHISSHQRRTSLSPTDRGFITPVFSNIAKWMQLCFCKIWAFPDLELTLFLATCKQAVGRHGLMGQHALTML